MKCGFAAVSFGALLFSPGVHAQEPAQTPSVAVPAVDLNEKAERQTKAEECRLHALSLYDAGDYGAAREEFARANQLVPSFRLLYNLAVVSLDLSDPASAYDYFERYLAEGGELVAPEKRLEVLGQLHDLAGRIATVTVLAAVPRAEIFIDHVSIGVAPLPRALHLNPRKISISAYLGDKLTPEQTLDLAAGSVRQITLRFPAPPPVAHRARAPIPWWAWTGTAALSAGAAVAGLEALSAHHEYNHQLGTITSRGELDRLDTRATRWSITADTLGVGALIVGAYSLYLTLHGASVPADSAKSSTKLSVQLSSNQLNGCVRF